MQNSLKDESSLRLRVPPGIVLLLASLFLSGCGEDTTADEAGASDSDDSSSVIVPLGEYRCYLHRGKNDAAPEFNKEDYQGYLNILPGRQYEWKLDLDTRGEFDIDPNTGKISWLTGLYANGKNRGQFVSPEEDRPILMIRSESESAAPVGLDCQHHDVPGR